MIFIILICTVIGYLCGSALIGLGVGLALFALTVWADSPSLSTRRRTNRLRKGR